MGADFAFLNKDQWSVIAGAVKGGNYTYDSEVVDSARRCKQWTLCESKWGAAAALRIPKKRNGVLQRAFLILDGMAKDATAIAKAAGLWRGHSLCGAIYPSSSPTPSLSLTTDPHARIRFIDSDIFPTGIRHCHR